MKHTCNFEFDTAEMRDAFLTWLADGGGEDGFLQDNTELRFDYWSQNPQHVFGPNVRVTEHVDS